MEYTKENFIAQKFCIINDMSEELKNLLIKWFPEDRYFATNDLIKISGYVGYCIKDLQWNYLSLDVKVKVSEITYEPKEWIGSEMQYWSNLHNEWNDVRSMARYRLKPKQPKEIAEIEELAAKIGYKVTLEKI
jgi:hypothetical protein